MLNLDQTLNLTLKYNKKQNYERNVIFYFFAIFSFLELLRGQVPEINLLQLIPGFYLLVLFLSFLYLILLSQFWIRLPLEIENRKGFGTKTIGKINFFILLKFSTLLFFLILIISLNTILPISLDFFNSSDEKSLENLWSFDEVLNLEIFLLVFLLFLSQIPLGIISYLNTEKNVNILPSLWKPIVLFVVIFSGFITPTIDGYTQINFALASISLYLIIINTVEKRVLSKFLGNSLFGF